jgi:hypothetical protein
MNMSNFAAPPATSFEIWHGWMSQLLASVRAQVDSAAVRHKAMAGESITFNLLWAKTAQGCVESGCYASMEHGGEVHFTPNVNELITFLKKLPESVRQGIVKGLTDEMLRAGMGGSYE